MSTGGELAWAIRPNSPQLKTALDAFIKTHARARRSATRCQTVHLQHEIRRERAVAGRDQEVQDLVGLFRKYGDKYDVDFLLMLAQGYQESRLDQTVKSQVGAVGVMQVMPATGKELKVGDITSSSRTSTPA